MAASEEVPETGRIRALRGPREEVDPRRPLEVLVERERTVDGSQAHCLTVFLAGAECPFSCSFCDLWRRTLESPTPLGALPTQLEAALEATGEPADADVGERRLKLYNASNFFEARAVPPADLSRIGTLAEPFERLVVECHPRLVDRRALEFAEALKPRLEVAMGLETVHPRALPRLNKGMTLDDFARAADLLREGGVALRAFVLVGAPGLLGRESVDWAVVSTAWALEQGVETVTLIPVRGGNGELERLAARGEFAEPTLCELETAFERALQLRGGVVLLDLWDLERFSSCPRCRGARERRLREMNRTGRSAPRIDCEACGGA